MPATVARKGISEPPVLYRQPLRIWGPSDFTGDQWRFLVGQAPIVRACVTTIIMYLQDREWFLQGDDQDAVAYYTDVLETADEGKGWNIWTARLEDDCMTMPFGGATEIGAERDGTVVWVAHLDAATMRPTGLTDFPYGQIDPWGSRDPVPFTEAQVGRVPWMPETRLKAYEWTRTPAADAIPAITALVRADRFWQSLLLDTPPAGILDLMDMTEQEASDWYESWKKLLSGQDAFKIPVLYGGQDRKQPATFIHFNQTPTELNMLSVIKNYAEQVTACFGLTLGDLGMFNQEIRLAGAAKMIELTKRQGPANVARSLKAMIDLDILPDGIEFHWRDIDTEDSLRKATGRNFSATALATAVNAGLVPPRLAQLAAEAFGIIPQEAIDAYNAELEGQVAGTAQEIAPADSLPTGDQRAKAPFPPRSKWAKKMKALADKLLAPSRQGFTRTRLKALIDAGIAAYGKEDKAYDGRNQISVRSRESAEAALAKKLAKETWWKSPNLVEDVFTILRGAYEEGIRDSIKAAGGKVKPATVNLTNKDVLAELETHAGEFITQIDEGTQNMIVRHIMAGVEMGRSSPDIATGILADEVRATLVERWKGRTESITNFEINRAETRATLRSYQEIGLETKRWVDVPGLACQLCRDNAALGDVPMDYQYETVFGEADGPPGHPTVCHCYATFSKSELKALGEEPQWWLGGDFPSEAPAEEGLVLQDVSRDYQMSHQEATSVREAADELLSGGEHDKEAEARTLLQGIADAPLREDTLYRGLSFASDEERTAFMDGLGDQVDISLASTSASKESALNYAKGDFPVLIEVEPGSPGMPLMIGETERNPTGYWLKEVLVSGRYSVEETAEGFVRLKSIGRLKIPDAQ